VVASSADDRIDDVLITPPIELGRKLIYASCRLDLSEAVVPGRLRLFSDQHVEPPPPPPPPPDPQDGAPATPAKKPSGLL
jgi:hypothetical protein